METRPLRLGGIGQLFPEFLPEARVPRVEVICPQPRRAVKVPALLDCVGGFGSMAKCIFSARNQEHNDLDFLGMFFDKDESENDLDINNQNGFFCGSPPVRTNNPVVWDTHFAEENLSYTSPMVTDETRNPARVERSHHTCSSSFEAKSDSRTEGFNRANPGPGLVVSARS